MCNSVITVGAVACLVCEKDITEAIHENFYRDPVQTYKQYTCPHCQTLLDVEVIPVPYFQLSMPIGRLASTRKGVPCKYCEILVEYGDMKPWRKDDDTVDMLCPGCDCVLVEGE
jgi:hypothetical protein